MRPSGQSLFPHTKSNCMISDNVVNCDCVNGRNLNSPNSYLKGVLEKDNFIARLNTKLTDDV